MSIASAYFYLVQRYLDNAARLSGHLRMAAGVWFKQRQQRLERRLLKILLRKHGGNVWHVANAIDERRSRLYRMFRRHGISPKEYRANSR